MNKALITTIAIAILATALQSEETRMCNWYSKQLSKSIKNANKAGSEGLIQERKSAMRMVKYYSGKAVIECETGGSRYYRAKEIRDRLK